MLYCGHTNLSLIVQPRAKEESRGSVRVRKVHDVSISSFQLWSGANFCISSSLNRTGGVRCVEDFSEGEKKCVQVIKQS